MRGGHLVKKSHKLFYRLWNSEREIAPLKEKVRIEAQGFMMTNLQ